MFPPIIRTMIDIPLNLPISLLFYAWKRDRKSALRPFSDNAPACFIYYQVRELS